MTPCLATNYVAGPCAACGEPVGEPAHLVTGLIREGGTAPLYHPACCPQCNAPARPVEPQQWSAADAQQEGLFG